MRAAPLSAAAQFSAFWLARTLLALPKLFCHVHWNDDPEDAERWIAEVQ